MRSAFFILIVFLALSDATAGPTPILLSAYPEARQPQLASTIGGDLYVAFGQSNSIYMARSTDGGQTMLPAVEVAIVPKLGLGMRRGPRIVATDRSVTISAISMTDGNLYSWNSQDKGVTWSAPLLVNSVLSCAREGLHAMTGNASGEMFLSWLDLRNGRMQLWGTRSSDGGISWEANRVIYISPDVTICECCHPSLTMDSRGQITAMWRNWLDGNRDLYTSVSRDHGHTFTEVTKLGQGSWSLKGCPMDGGSIARHGDRVAQVWRREGAIFLTIDGSTEVRLTGVGTQPVVVGGRDGFEFFWQTGGELYYQKEGQWQPEVVARNAYYASSVWSEKHQHTFVVWDSTPPKHSH